MANDDPDPADSPENEAMMEDVDEGLSLQVAHASLVDNGNGDDNGDVNEDDDEDEDEDDDDDDEDADDPMQDLPPAVVARVEQLQDLNSEREQIMMAYLEERAALELKYRRQCQPLYEKRAQIVKGSGGGNGNGNGNANHENDDGEGIPQFWVCAMGHEEDVAELLTEEDVDCLEYLTDITCVDFNDGKGFELQFHFSEQNPYFTNPVLTKTYHVPNLLLADEPILKNVLGCDIDWKEGKCLTYRTTKKKQRGKGKHSGQIRTVAKKERKDSFFHFFLPPKLPNMEEMDEDEADRLEEAFDADYDVAQAFRLHIVPKAILWFTGQGDAEEMQLAMMTDEDLDAVVE